MCCSILEQKAEDGFAPSALRAHVEAGGYSRKKGIYLILFFFNCGVFF